MRIISLCNKIIKFSFYFLFVLVPLVFWKENSELFELNKMWLTFILVVLIGSAWAIKSLINKNFYIQKTPLDLPIVLFLLSQFISTIFSLDTHVSIWGYYSRFNGGLLSEVSYVFLYYAFLSNFTKDELLNIAEKILKISIITGLIVALWGLPSHFGYDPTCLLFRGELNVACWTEDFQPKIRIFSTLGQPAWLGAYLSLLIPITIGFLLQKTQNTLDTRGSENQKLRISEFLKHRVFRVFWKPATLILISALFYVDLLYTKSRAAFIAVWISMAFVIGFQLSVVGLRSIRSLFVSLINRKLITGLISIIIIFLVATFLIGAPFPQLKNFSLEGFKNQKTSTSEQNTGTFSTGGGGTDSGKIRLYVWRGALEIFRNYPIFGTGVETYAFAYYKFRPVEHNLTSEWNFLYNKAHNEYLNYLATTGAFGLGSYLFMISLFLWKAIRYILLKKDFLVAALISSYLSILITNFFGFSVVIMNIYLFMIPAFVFVLTKALDFKNVTTFSLNIGGKLEKFALAGSFIVGLYLLFYLLKFWTADILYAFGSNLSRAGEYQRAYPYLKTASERISFEPTFRDEFAQTSATLAVDLASEGSSQSVKLTQDLAKDAILATTFITQGHPNNLVFLKSQVRIYYTLSQIDDRYLSLALTSIQNAQKLAPTDSNISYNLGILYGQNKDYKKAIETLAQTIKLKPDYINAYYALGLFYHQMANDLSAKGGSSSGRELQQKASYQMKYILGKLDPKNQLAKEALETWQQELPSPSK